MKRKGFTLIELLAVIVILAIIALIVTPTISKIIENTKKEAFKQSVIGVIQSGEYYIAKHVLETNGLEITYPIEFTCNGESCSHDDVSLAFQGATPKGGKIIVESRKEVIAEYITDGKFCASGTKLNLQIAKSCSDIDITGPVISGSLEGAIIHLSIIEEESGVKGYCVNTTEDSASCSWIDTSEKNIDHTLESAGTYYVYARDNKDNISNMLTFTADVDAFCAYEPGHEFDFAYTGNVQTFDIPCDGLYRLEVWGSKGGSIGSYQGGNGGYSSGYTTLTKGNSIYVVVGGQPYNGGGRASGSDHDDYDFGYERSGAVTYGGGATHIAKVTGLLADIGYASFVTQGNGYIVAGGGGSSAYANPSDSNLAGGSGGGVNGGNGSAYNATGGTQTSGYAFGQGQTGGTNLNSPAGNGGGGFYGGKTSYSGTGGGGVSGWIGGVPQIEYNGTTYSPSTSNGVNGSTGKAKITLVEY